MSTRGILARATEDGWLGVFHNYDSRPEDLGNHLLMAITTRDGDLDGFLRELIDDSPHPWGYFPNRSASASDEHFFRPEDLEEHVTYAWVEWFYLFSAEDRRLQVWDGLPKDGATLVHDVRFDTQGHSEPAVFDAPGLPWWSIPEDEGWEADGERALAARTLFASHMARWCRENDRALDDARRQVGAAVEQAVLAASYAPHEARNEAERLRREQVGVPERPAFEVPPGDTALRATGWWSDTTRYWRVSIGSRALLYRSGNALRQGIDALRVWRPDGTQAAVRLNDVFDEHAEPLFVAVREAGILAQHGVRHAMRDDEGLWRPQTVTEEKEGPDQISLVQAQAVDPKAKLGDTLYSSLPSAWADELVLDWLRMGQVSTPEGWSTLDVEVDAPPGAPIEKRFWLMTVGLLSMMWFSDWPAAAYSQFFDTHDQIRLLSWGIMVAPMVPLFTERHHRPAAVAWLAIGVPAVAIALSGSIDLTQGSWLHRGGYALAVVFAGWLATGDRT